jgi:thymidylate synthase (FAD)
MLQIISSCEEAYMGAVNDGGVPAQDARAVLPNATATNLVVTGNLRSWLHLFHMRAFNPKAQGEIRDFTVEIANGLAEKFPLFWDIYERIKEGKVKYL